MCVCVCVCVGVGGGGGVHCLETSVILKATVSLLLF